MISTHDGSPNVKPRRLARTLRLFYLLADRQQVRSLDALAEACQVCRRTVLRDLDMLREAGVPIIHDPDQGGWMIDDGDRTTSIIKTREWPLSWDETVALFSLLVHPEAPAGSELQHQLQIVEQRLERWMGQRYRGLVQLILIQARLLRRFPTTKISNLREEVERQYLFKVENCLKLRAWNDSCDNGRIKSPPLDIRAG